MARRLNLHVPSGFLNTTSHFGLILRTIELSIYNIVYRLCVSATNVILWLAHFEIGTYLLILGYDHTLALFVGMFVPMHAHYHTHTMAC